MGACDFIQKAKGKNASEAFRSAVQDALYEYGHRGYTGSIAEKHDFRMIPAPSQNNIRVMLLDSIKYYEQNVDYLQKNYEYKLKYLDNLPSFLKIEEAHRVVDKAKIELENAKIRIKKIKSQAKSKRDIKVTEEICIKYAQYLISNGDPRIDDKWGPAGCIDLGKGNYLFFGWASS